jgi:drug/metabolite transporter (DMT)-like permease
VPQNLRAHLALIAVAFIYGGNYSIAKIVMDDGYLHPFAFILLRGAIGMLLFWFFHALFVRERVERRDLPLLAICGLLGIAINQLFFFAGLRLTTPINASLIMTTTPILVLVASAIMLGEVVNGRKIIGITLGALGAIFLIAYGERIQLATNGFMGDLMIIVNASAFGIYLVISKPLTQKYHPITIVKWAFTFGFLGILPFGFQPIQETRWATFPTEVWASIAYVLVGTTFFAYLLNAYALKHVNASVVSIYIYLQPLVATVIALSIGKDQLDLVKAGSGCLIFIGVFLVSRNPQRILAPSILSHTKRM